MGFTSAKIPEIVPGIEAEITIFVDHGLHLGTEEHQ
jgi:hypothetical protein